MKLHMDGRITSAFDMAIGGIPIPGPMARDATERHGKLKLEVHNAAFQNGVRGKPNKTS